MEFSKVSPRRLRAIVRAHTQIFTKRIVRNLSDDLRLPSWQGHENPLAGHCYVASEALYHLTGGPVGPWKPMWIRHDDGDEFDVGHWFLIHRETGEVLDITAGQFKRAVQYEHGRGRGFLTRKPSARARELIRRVENDDGKRRTLELSRSGDEARRAVERPSRSVHGLPSREPPASPTGVRAGRLLGLDPPGRVADAGRSRSDRQGTRRPRTAALPSREKRPRDRR